jgi:hypothetical protein
MGGRLPNPKRFRSVHSPSTEMVADYVAKRQAAKGKNGCNLQVSQS